MDSLLGSQNELQRQLDSVRIEIAKSKNEIRTMLKDKNETTTILNEAKRLISEQMDKIKELETEVKRLSGGKSHPKKGN
ncbi:MAG TPA: hypothetical protein VI461_10835 [Chitinophagaceae bacterium]|nr:hypothetical protein [Chitinophagaceae bacterium]